MKGIHSSIISTALLAQAAFGMPALQSRSKLARYGCTGEQNGKIHEALSSCAQLAQQAARAAESGGAIFQAFFKTDDAQTKNQVADRFRAIAGECSAQNAGKVALHCSNADNPGGQGGCGGFTYGISYPQNIYLCPHFYQMPLAPESCNGFTNNRACAIIHELTHRDEVFAPGTQDTYGVDEILKLDGKTALMMADTYSLFATYTAKGCMPPGKSAGNPYDDGSGGDTGSSSGNPPSNEGSPYPGPSSPTTGGSSNQGPNSPPVKGPSSGGQPPYQGSQNPTTGGPTTTPNNPPTGNTGPSTGSSNTGSSKSPVCYEFNDGAWGAQASSGSGKAKASICYEYVNGKWTSKGVQMADGSK